jgi:hypothetical protein
MAVNLPDAGETFLIRRNFLEDTICDDLSEAYRTLSTLIVNRAPGSWDGRFVWHSDVAKVSRALADHMLDAQRRATALIVEFYRLKQPVYPDLLQINTKGRCETSRAF